MNKPQMFFARLTIKITAPTDWEDAQYSAADDALYDHMNALEQRIADSITGVTGLEELRVSLEDEGF